MQHHASQESSPLWPSLDMTPIGGQEVGDQPPEARTDGAQKPAWMKQRKAKKNGSILNSPVSKRLRSLIQPRNATMVLHLLHPDLSCNITEGGASVPYRAEIEFNSRRFIGFGANKTQARASASELVLRSLVQPSAMAEGSEEGGCDTPWLALAGFAVHKLLCDWQRGSVGHTPAMVSPLNHTAKLIAELHEGRETIVAPTPGAAQDNIGLVPDNEIDMTSQTDICQLQPPHKKQKVSGRQVMVNDTVITVPDNAADIHPVTLLTRMWPQALFKIDPAESQVNDRFVSQVTVAGCNFSCAARTKKQAKADVARIALQQLFNVQYPDNGEA